MEHIYASSSISISELKKNPSRVIAQSEGAPVAILNHNKPSAYLVPAAAFESMMEYLDDLELVRLVKERASEPSFEVSLNDL
jgi:antitoxin StbD